MKNTAASLRFKMMLALLAANWGDTMNIKDIAALAQVSVATVSRVLNSDPSVKAATQKKVQAVIKQTGYRPNVAGRNLRTSKSKKILAILPTIMNSIYSDMIAGLTDSASKLGYDVMVAITNRDAQNEKKYLDMLYTKEIDGAVTFVSALDDAYLEEVAAQHPLVLCSGKANCEHLSYTSIDNERAAFDATHYLIQLGHTKIAAISGRFNRVYELERKAGYLRALTQAGITADFSYFVEGDYNYESGYALTQQLMALPNSPTAIFAFADSIAGGCIKYLNDAGIKAGKQVDVMGFDNITLGEIVSPSLTTVAQPFSEMGALAFGLLQEKMEDMSSIRKAIILDHKLVIRNSTRK